MAWTESRMFQALISDIYTATAAPQVNLSTQTIKAALYDNSITPARDAASASARYGGGVWVTTGSQTGTTQVYHTGQWAQGGEALTSKTTTFPATGVFMFDAADTPSSGSAATMSNIYGCLVYDDTLTTQIDQALCYNYFGGTPASVTNGTFTIQWNTNGVFRITV